MSQRAMGQAPGGDAAGGGRGGIVTVVFRRANTFHLFPFVIKWGQCDQPDINPGASVLLEKIGKYKIIDKIGTGAMGVVYKGFDPKMGRYVAIKTMSAQYINNEESRTRFYREATAPAKLFHPNIVAIYDLDEDNGVPFIVMEFLDGLDLKYFRGARIRFTIPQILNILIQVSEGLDFAHKRGIIHRDVKPANIMLMKNGRVKLVDFGIARLAEGTQQTQTGIALGTPAYMSPEQAKGLKVDPGTDQYSVGVIAYELVSGENPFQAENYTGVLYKIIHHFPPALHTLVPACPPAFGAIAMRALEKEKEARFPDLKAFSEACQHVLQDFTSEDGRLEMTIQGAGTADSRSVEEPYKVRLIRKYIREFQFEAASRLLRRLRDESSDATLLQSLQTELAGQSMRKRCTDLVKIGEGLVESGDLDMALINFNEALELDPDNVEAITWVQRARRLKREKLFQEKIKPLLDEAAAKTAEGAFLEAAGLYRRVLEIDPEYIEVSPLIDENERQQSLLNQRRRLAEDIRHQVRAANLTGAFERLQELEKLAPAEEETRQLRAEVWRAFKDELAAALGETAGPDQLPRLRSWLDGIFSARPVVTFFAANAHPDEKNEFLQFIRQWVQTQLQGRQLDMAQMAMGILLPVFPRQPSLAALAAELENLRQSEEDSRQRQRAMEQRLSDGLRQIRQLLTGRQIEEAKRELQELSRVFPAERSLMELQEEATRLARELEDEQRFRAQMDQVRRHLEAGELERAKAMAGSLETAWPRHPELRQLAAALEEKERTLLRQGEIQRLQNEIGACRDSANFENGLELARKGISRYPDEPAFSGLLEELRLARAEHEKREEIRKQSALIRGAADQDEYLKAGKLLYELKNRYPADAAVLDLLKGFHEKRFSYIRGAIDSAQALNASRAFGEARQILQHALEECPDSVDLQNAMQEIVVGEGILRGIAEARSCLTEKKYDLALATLEGLLAQFPEESNIVRLYEDARRQRNAYLLDNIQHARSFSRENDFERALSLLKAAQEIVPNAPEIQDELESVQRQRASYFRQRKEAAEEARLLAQELENALAEARKQQSRGHLFDALRTLEKFRTRFPQVAGQADEALREIQQLIDLQMNLAGEESPVAAVTRRSRRHLLVVSGVALAALVAAVYLFWNPGKGTGEPVLPPAVLALDFRPWGELVKITRLDSGESLPLPADKITPLQLELAPGRYRISCRLPEQGAPLVVEDVTLKSGEYRVVRKVSPVLEQKLEQVMDELTRDPRP